MTKSKVFKLSIVSLALGLIAIYLGGKRPSPNPLDRKILIAHITKYQDSLRIDSFTNANSVHLKGIRILKDEKPTFYLPVNLKLNKGNQSVEIKDSTSIDKRPQEERFKAELVIDSSSNLFTSTELYFSPKQKIVKPYFNDGVIRDACPMDPQILRNVKDQVKFENSCLIIREADYDSFLKKFFQDEIKIDLDSTSFISFLNFRDNTLEISSIQINGGRGGWSDGMYFSGSLNLYQVNDFRVSNITVLNSLAEDAINIKESFGEISKSQVHNAFSDAIDIDLSTVTLTGITTKIAGGDGLDFSKSTGIVNRFQASEIKDKGISVGENSTVTASYLDITKSTISIAVKDSSTMNFPKNRDRKDDSLKDRIQIYQKKPYWNVGKVIYE